MGFGKPLLGGFSVPPRRLAIVLGDTLAEFIHDAEAELGIGITLLRRGQKLAKCRGVVAAVIGGAASVKIRPARRG